MKELSDTLKMSSQELSKNIEKSILNTEVILYAPWFTSHIKDFSHIKEFALTNKFLDEKIDSITTPSKLINLEKKIIKIVANGYPITEIPKTTISNVSLDVYVSYIAENIHKKIEETIRNSLVMVEKISYTTSPLLFFGKIKKLMVQEDNICFVYVGGEITEYGIIEDDALSYYGTFPIGKHDFLREVQGEVRSYDYDLLYQKEVQIKTKTKQDSFESLRQEWKEDLISGLFNAKHITPNKILLVSDTKTKDFFTKLINQQGVSDENIFTNQYRIINFDISYIKDIISYKTPVNTNELDLQLEALI